MIITFVLYLESKQLEKEKSKEISNHMVIQVARDASIDRRRVSFHNKRKQQVVNGRSEYRCHRSNDGHFFRTISAQKSNFMAPLSQLRYRGNGQAEIMIEDNNNTIISEKPPLAFPAKNPINFYKGLSGFGKLYQDCKCSYIL